jgi:hypothetical protein
VRLLPPTPLTMSWGCPQGPKEDQRIRHVLATKVESQRGLRLPKPHLGCCIGHPPAQLFTRRIFYFRGGSTLFHASTGIDNDGVTKDVFSSDPPRFGSCHT